MPILQTEHINYYYQDGDTKRNILQDISIDFEKGKMYAILGSSGSGKTTFLSLLGALDQPKSGKIYYEGTDIETIGLEQYRRNKISIIFQSYNIIPYMTALENVMVAMHFTENAIPKVQEKVATNLLDFIGISKDKANRLVTQLSGGEQQRVAIARSLATNVDVILADEPTGNLDENTEADIIEVFQTLAHEHNKLVIVVTHSQEIARHADVVLELKQGMFVNG